MPEPVINPASYFCQPKQGDGQREQSWWTWSPTDNAIVTTAHHTIVFRNELATILLASRLRRLPPLDDILFVLMACRGPAILNSTASNSNAFELAADATYACLVKIAELPEELRLPFESRAHLLRFIFESESGYGSYPSIHQLVLLLNMPFPQFYLAVVRAVPLTVDHQSSLRAFAAAHVRLSAESISLRVETGLDQLIWPAEIDAKSNLGSSCSTRDLIEDFCDERDEVAGVARVARALLAVLSRPRGLDDPDDCPSGGFSDIAQRGSPDRLLTSELAHDDVTLAARIAMNEALYLRREVPPDLRTRSRAILFDSGIRLWGIPRIYAASVTLALAASAEDESQVRAFCLHNDRLQSLQLRSRQGVIQLLASLNIDRHLGKSLELFVQRSRSSESDIDRLIVTSQDSFSDPEFQRQIRELEVPSLGIATVDRSGAFELMMRTPHGYGRVSSAQLDLQKLLRGKPDSAQSLVDSEAEKYPAIFSEKRFPLRLPDAQINQRQAWVVRGLGYFEISRQRRLLWWDKRNCGPLEVHNHVPIKATLRWADFHPQGNQLGAVFGDAHGRSTLLSINLASGSVGRFPLPRAAVDYGGSGGILCEYDFPGNRARFLSTIDGRCLGDYQFPADRDFRLFGHRFLKSRPVQANSAESESQFADWFTLSYDGHVGKLNKILDAKTAKQHDVIAMMDSHLREGPIGLKTDGTYYLPEIRESVDAIESSQGIMRSSPFVHTTSTEYIVRYWPKSDDRPRSEPRTGHFNSTSGTFRLRKGVADLKPRGLTVSALESEEGWPQTRFEKRWRFRGIGVQANKGLALITESRSTWIFVQRQDSICFRRTKTVIGPFNQGFLRFHFAPLNQKGGLSVARAEWKDGSVAWIDSRGLLHLRSALTSIPEISIVLTGRKLDNHRLTDHLHGETAGWCADGRTWGPAYFHTVEPNTSGTEIFMEIIQPFVEHIS